MFIIFIHISSTTVHHTKCVVFMMYCVFIEKQIIHNRALLLGALPTLNYCVATQTWNTTRHFENFAWQGASVHSFLNKYTSYISCKMSTYTNLQCTAVGKTCFEREEMYNEITWWRLQNNILLFCKSIIEWLMMERKGHVAFLSISL